MISFRVGDYRFHYRAAAIVRDGDYVLLHRLDGDDFWALPGGRVNPGEQAKDTIVREFREELGAEVVCRELICVGENFFRGGAEPHHEVGFYFSASLLRPSSFWSKETVHYGVEGSKRLEFKWFRVNELASIDMRPDSLRRNLAAGSLPLHFVQEG